MRPYYSDDFVTLYHGDWRDIVPGLSGVDLVLADPPYGVSLKSEYRKLGRAQATNATDYPRIEGDDQPFDPAPFLGYPGVVLWGANYYADKLPPRGSWLVWNKIAGTSGKRDHGFNDGADCELAWVAGVTGAVPRIFDYLLVGMLQAGESKKRVHHSQKPVALMAWCLSFFPNTRLVLDPFCGSGPIPRACKDRGIKCIAIEIAEAYCERTAERCGQEVLDLGVA